MVVYRVVATPEPPESVADKLMLTGPGSAVLGHGEPLQAIEVLGGVVSAGGTGPASAARTVFTTVPFADRGCSQSRNDPNTDWLTDAS